MNLSQTVLRVAFAYAFLLVILRVSGKRCVSHGSLFDFVLALVLGDLVDDLVWAEVGIAQFVVATSTLVLTQIAFLKVSRLRPQP